jgi:hypothetical protein
MPNNHGGDSPARDEPAEESMNDDGALPAELKEIWTSDDPPPPNGPAVELTDPVGKLHRLQRSWLIWALLLLLLLTIGTDFAGAALLRPGAWARLAPEVKEVRTWLFFTTGPVVGFYFFAGQDRGK